MSKTIHWIPLPSCDDDFKRLMEERKKESATLREDGFIINAKMEDLRIKEIELMRAIDDELDRIEVEEKEQN